MPYEYGRLKSHRLISQSVISWFDHGVYEASKADYLKLGCCTRSEQELQAFLKVWMPKSSPPGRPTFKGRSSTGQTRPKPPDPTAPLGSLTFPPSILAGKEAFLTARKDKRDALAQFLAERLETARYDDADPPGKGEWIRWSPGPISPATETLQHFVVDQLNEIVRGDEIWDQQRFAHVQHQLTSKTTALLRLSERGPGLKPARIAKLNRLLLEDSYPDPLRR